jgi:23S rRNA (uracil1939-C5)-methyltransferase
MSHGAGCGCARLFLLGVVEPLFMDITPSQSQVTAYHPGDFLENLLVTDLTVEGRAVARHGGRVVFLDQGLPEARVSARITAVKKRVIEAAVTEVIKASPHAIPFWCPHAKVCGACLWQHFSPDSALEWKRGHIREAFSRIGKITDIDVAPVQPSPKIREYRNKMAYAFADGPDASLLLGLRQRKEHSIVEVTECGIQPAPAMAIVDYVRKTAKRLGLRALMRTGERHSKGYLRFLVIHTPEYRPAGEMRVLVECITGGNHGDRIDAASLPGGEMASSLSNTEALRLLGEALMEQFRLIGFVHSERRQTADVAQGERLICQIGAASYQERFGALTLTVPYNAFLQTNTGAATLLYELIAREAQLDGTQTIWDLYSGVGSIALSLAPHAREVHGLEIQADAVIAAQNNSEALGFTHCTFHHGALTPERVKKLPAPDLIILDPPRGGLDSPVVEVLRHTSAGRMLYVSCDVGTQARDLAALARHWRPLKSFPVDMFPNTAHVENLVVLERRVLPHAEKEQV